MSDLKVMVSMLVMVAVGGQRYIKWSDNWRHPRYINSRAIAIGEGIPPLDIWPNAIGGLDAQRLSELRPHVAPILGTVEAFMTKSADLLQVQGLTKKLGGIAAVNNVNLDVKQGEIVGLIGPNGAGKTTLFIIVTGFLKPTAGEVRFRGSNITRMPPHRRGLLGIVCTFQLRLAPQGQRPSSDRMEYLGKETDELCRILGDEAIRRRGLTALR